MKTSELTGPALDWAVAKCEGWESSNQYRLAPPRYSSDWAQGGPIIEREAIAVHCHSKARRVWIAEPHSGQATHQTGPTPLIAAMRCYVASKLGDEVEIPDGL